MLSGETAIVAGVGGFVGMAGALGYGFKLMVEIIGKQLTVQNTAIVVLESGILERLNQHVADCAACKMHVAETAAGAAAASASAAAVAAAAAAAVGSGKVRVFGCE